MKKESKFKIARRYAVAMYEAAEESGDLKKTAADLRLLEEAVSEEPEIAACLANPLWRVQDKKDALKKTAQKLKLADETLKSLCVIADNGRFAELGSILKAFRSLYYEKHNIEEVRVVTVKPLSKQQDEKLRNNLEKLLEKKVVVSYEIKPEILGGLIVSYGSDMVDDSISGKLKQLETVMKGGR